MMKPPPNTVVHDWETSTFWMDEFGILCSISKKTPPQSIDKVKKSMEEFKRIADGKKLCLLADVTHSSESSKEARDYVALELPKIIKAVAMISNSALGKMMANLFFSIKAQPYPTKMFNTENEAKEWLKQYL